MNVKGTALRGAFRFAKSLDPAGGVEGVLAALPEGTRSRLDDRIIANAWYPYEVYRDLLAVLRSRLGGHRLPEMGRFLAEQDVAGAFQVVAAAASVESIMRRSGVFWAQHCDTGRFVTRDAGPDFALGAIEGCPEISEDHCALVGGWIAGIVREAGGTGEAVVHTHCVHRGDPTCDYDVHWTS